MAGTVATIIGLELSMKYNDRAITKALREIRVKSDVRVQPINGNYAYLVLNNKKKAEAEAELLTLTAAFKKAGGKEFNQDVLTGDIPKPAIARMNNDWVKNAPPIWEQNGMTKEAWDAGTLERLNEMK